MTVWEELERPGLDAVTVDGVEVRRRSRVRLRPRRGADVFDIALAGRVAVVEEVMQSMDGSVQLAVTVEDDPGRDLGANRQIGHRFFFSCDEVEPLGEQAPEPSPPRVLVAGIGNVFLGDDGFGVAVAGQLAQSRLPAGVVVEDYGIRGMDLAYALQDFETVVLIDALPRGEPPGTLYLIEADPGEPATAAPDAHGMDPVAVLALAQRLGDRLPRVLVLGCEPAVMPGPDEDFVADLSEPVRAAIPEAVRMAEELLEGIMSSEKSKEEAQP